MTSLSSAQSNSENPNSLELAARCHEIHTGLGFIDVPEFEDIRTIGMAVRMALHIRGLPLIRYDTLKLVATHYLSIPSTAVRGVIQLLAEVEYVKIQSEGKTYRAILPNVPYYESMYEGLGTYAANASLNEAELLSITLLNELAKSPQKLDTVRSTLGVSNSELLRALHIGAQGSYFRIHRSRGRDIAISPTYFSENSDVYSDIVAGSGSTQIAKVIKALRQMQGVPLSIIQSRKEIAGISLNADELNIVYRLAQDGAVKPPRIDTKHAGEQYFLFTPTPGGAALAPTKRDIYERAMALVAAVRQGQFLAHKYPIRSPGAVLYKLRSNLKLNKATTEASQQYQQLVHLRVAQLIDVGYGYFELRIVETEENIEALDMALALVDAGITSGGEVDQDARNALQQEHEYVESLVASGDLHRHKVVTLTEAQQLEMDNLFLQ